MNAAQASSPRCISCEYDLAGISAAGGCPECDFPIAMSLADGPWELRRRRRLRRAAWCAGLALSLNVTTLLVASAVFMPGFEVVVYLLVLLTDFVLIVGCWGLTWERSLANTMLRLVSAMWGVLWLVELVCQLSNLFTPSTYGDSPEAELWRQMLCGLFGQLTLISLAIVLRALRPGARFMAAATTLVITLVATNAVADMCVFYKELNSHGPFLSLLGLGPFFWIVGMMQVAASGFLASLLFTLRPTPLAVLEHARTLLAA